MLVRYLACMKVISVIGLKGGSGKTSTAVPLAYYASQLGPTALLDLDPTPSASQWVNAADLLSERLACERLGIEHLSQSIRGIRDSGQVDWVVIDTPPVARDVVMSAAGEADLAVIPVHMGSGDLAQLAQTLHLMELPRRLNPELPILVVLNHTGTAPAITRQTREAIEADGEVQRLGVTVATTDIPFRAMYSVAKGQKPGVKWWHYENLWAEVKGML